jgi:serine phosphatase RsbU (regulator of sigma subunit)
MLPITSSKYSNSQEVTSSTLNPIMYGMSLEEMLVTKKVLMLECKARRMELIKGGGLSILIKRKQSIVVILERNMDSNQANLSTLSTKLP